EGHPGPDRDRTVPTVRPLARSARTPREARRPGPVRRDAVVGTAQSGRDFGSAAVRSTGLRAGQPVGGDSAGLRSDALLRDAPGRRGLASGRYVIEVAVSPAEGDRVMARREITVTR